MLANFTQNYYKTGKILSSSCQQNVIYIYIYTHFACLGVCLNPINVQTAEPIGPKFFVGSLMNLIKMN